MGKCKWCSNFTQGEPTCSACKKKLMGDNSSKNCKMDAFKPNRLRPGIFHDVFSKNMTTKLVRVSFGKKNTPKEDREYRIEGRGPVGTMKEYKKFLPGEDFEIEDNISDD